MPFGITCRIQVKFTPYINATDNVIDFGAGGGYLLKNIKCSKKIGIEINDFARDLASKQGITLYKVIDEVDDNWADVIISNHALEHVENPLETLRSLKSKLKIGGKIIIVVPHQTPNEKYVKSDINQHLYTWNPLTLGNLLQRAGYKVKSVDVLRHAWPPYYQELWKLIGEKNFHRLSYLYALYKNSYQIRGIAIRHD